MSDAVKALLEELNLERSVPLRDVWAAIEQHKANLATIKSLESHNAKLVESRDAALATSRVARADLEKMRAQAAQVEKERDHWRGRYAFAELEAPKAHKAEAERDAAKAEAESVRIKLADLKALLASGQCVDLARVNDLELGGESVELFSRESSMNEDGRDLKAWLIEKAEVKL